MGSFKAYIERGRGTTLSRSVLHASVGPTAKNVPDDLRLIHHTLSSAGLLRQGASPDMAGDAIFRAIRHARKSIQENTATTGTNGDDVLPGDLTERAIRRAVAVGRLHPATHTVREFLASSAPRSLLSGGMRRALGKIETVSSADFSARHFRRALLPSISMQTFQANRRLVEALINEGQIPGLEDLMAVSLSSGAKQGYADVRDFMDTLRRQQPGTAELLATNVASRLNGRAARRFRKLWLSQPPVEADFE